MIIILCLFGCTSSDSDPYSIHVNSSNIHIEMIKGNKDINLYGEWSKDMLQIDSLSNETIQYFDTISNSNEIIKHSRFKIFTSNNATFYGVYFADAFLKYSYCGINQIYTSKLTDSINTICSGGRGLYFDNLKTDTTYLYKVFLGKPDMFCVIQRIHSGKSNSDKALCLQDSTTFNKCGYKILESDIRKSLVGIKMNNADPSVIFNKCTDEYGINTEIKFQDQIEFVVSIDGNMPADEAIVNYKNYYDTVRKIKFDTEGNSKFRKIMEVGWILK